MHPDSTLARRHTWGRRMRLLVEGLVLGGVQLLLLAVALPVFTEPPPVRLPPVLVVVLSACSYLVVSLSEGFLAASRTGTIRSGISTAGRVALISVLPIAIPLVGLVVLQTYAMIPPPNSQGLDRVITLVFVLLDGCWAWVVSTLGGWVGGMVGHLSAPRGNQSSLHTGHQPPPGRAPGGT